MLRTWLKDNPELERLEYLKLWKGLYFAMWMADKRPVQQELSVNIALLLNDIPRSRRNMWLDCFWEIMQTHWEKLDKHRMSKYQLFTRIVVAEMFKSLRLGGWADGEIRATTATFTRSVPHSAQDGVNAPSTGLLLHLLRLFWDELRPQLSEEPRASTEALMVLLEPFFQLAEGSFLGALVKHVKEHLLLKAPSEIMEAVVARVLDGAAKASTAKANRQALYDTADELERRLRPPAEATEAAGKRPGGARGGVQRPSRRERRRLREAGGAAAAAEGEAVANGATGFMSPLMLPEAAEPIVDDATAAGAKAGRKARRSAKAPAAGAGKRKSAAAGGGMVAKRRKKAA